MSYLDNIPEELRKLDQWVVITKDSKVPLNPRSTRAASSSDPATWSPFSFCREIVDAGVVENVGFVFDDNGYIGIDIDAAWDEDGLMTPQCAELIGLCHSYTERSRSGRGFHIILRGELPFKGRNNQNGIEIYKDSRYFITTGQVFLYREIEENQRAIDTILEKYFPDTVKESNGQKVSQRVYTPLWELPQDGRIKLRPIYPRIPSGCRNICLTSLAGMLHSQGYGPDMIYDELRYANVAACEPCLWDGEIEAIVNSVTRYKR